jgi:hypothetical protein
VTGRIEDELSHFQEQLGSLEAEKVFPAFMVKRKPEFSHFK